MLRTCSENSQDARYRRVDRNSEGDFSKGIQVAGYPVLTFGRPKIVMTLTEDLLDLPKLVVILYIVTVGRFSAILLSTVGFPVFREIL